MCTAATPSKGSGKMSERLILLTCENHRAAVERIIAAGTLPDVSVQFFSPQCVSPMQDWSFFREQIAACSPEPARVLLLGGSCVAGLGSPPSDLADCRVIGGEDCTRWYLEDTALADLRRGGGYLITSGWLRRWPEQMLEWGFDRATAIEFFRESASRLVLLDDGLDPGADARLAALSEHLELPAEAIPTGLSHLSALLVQSVYDWQLEHQRARSSEAIDNANLRAANYAMLADLVTHFASASNEDEIIQLAFDTMNMLFAPKQVAYLPIIAGVAGTPRHGNVAPADLGALARRLADLTDDYTWTPDEAGFTLRVACRGETVGVLEASEFAYPEHRKSYLDVAFGLASACGLALAQARSVQALQQSEEKFRTIISSMSDLIFLLDGDDVFVDIYCQEDSPLFVPPEEIRGRRLRDLIPPQICDLYDECAAKVRATGKSHGYEYPLQMGDREMWFVAVLDLHLDQESVVATIRDITEHRRDEEERLKLEKKVQQAQKLESLGVLAGGIAHDFNNMLVGILGNAELALMDLSPESPVRKSIYDITVASKRAADLAQQMLAYSGKGKFVILNLDLQPLVEEITHLLRTSLSKKAIVKFDFASDVPSIEADATQIRQIIMNLLINASEAIGDRSGVISIRTGAQECDRSYLDESSLDRDLPEGVYSYLEVVDTGCGMDRETVALIFDPFFTTKFTGRGLGLAAVLGIVRGHRGIIKVQSRPGQGTTFKVLFPATEEPASPDDTAARERIEGSLTGKTVLLVDDDKTVRLVGRRMLERFGMEVETAADGRLALELFEVAP